MLRVTGYFILSLYLPVLLVCGATTRDCFVVPSEGGKLGAVLKLTPSMSHVDVMGQLVFGTELCFHLLQCRHFTLQHHPARTSACSKYTRASPKTGCRLQLGNWHLLFATSTW
eukprot:761937-Hanusia_phi.AAC.4